jgi:hypothetical protein
MKKLSRGELYSLENYAGVRPEFRRRVMEHKKRRQVAVGPNATLHFEDRLTMQYQIQEMLRVERVFEAAGIEEELAAYNPLIPDGRNWKATLMIEYPEVEERRERLAMLRGVEEMTYVQVTGFHKVFPFANEDLARDNGQKTSSVHFMRFELTPDMIRAVKAGAAVAMGIEHPHYHHRADVLPQVREALARDLD